MLSQRGLEIFFGEHEVLYLSFPDAKKRSEFYAALTAQSAVVLKEEVKGNIMLKWQNGEISNYDYLMHLNNFADRSFNDLTQYVGRSTPSRSTQDRSTREVANLFFKY